MKPRYNIRKPQKEEFYVISHLILQEYYNEDCLVGQVDRVTYQQMLADIRELATLPSTHVYVALLHDCIVGAILYFEDLTFYGLGTRHLSAENTAGIRFLTVRPGADNEKIALLLVRHCIQTATSDLKTQIITHCSGTMDWQRRAFEQIKFERSVKLDYRGNGMSVFGFHLPLVCSTNGKVRAFLGKLVMGFRIVAAWKFSKKFVVNLLA